MAFCPASFVVLLPLSCIVNGTGKFSVGFIFYDLASSTELVSCVPLAVRPGEVGASATFYYTNGILSATKLPSTESPPIKFDITYFEFRFLFHLAFDLAPSSSALDI